MKDLKDLILKFLSEAESDVSLTEIQEKLRVSQPSLNRRSLQRAVLELVKAGQISRHGAGPATKYRSSNPERKDEQDAIPLSAAAKRQLAYLALPLIKRTPVTYRDELLFKYVPNKDFYLSNEIRTQLHDMGRTGPDDRPAGTHLRDVLGRLLIDLSWASSKLEGNRYTLLDTKRLIEEGKLAEGTDRIEAVMILNHKAAIEMIAEEPDHVGIDRRTFLNLHALLADGLMRDEEAVGRLRRRPVDITGSVYTPTAVPQRIDDCFIRVLATAREISDPRPLPSGLSQPTMQIRLQGSQNAQVVPFDEIPDVGDHRFIPARTSGPRSATRMQIPHKGWPDVMERPTGCPGIRTLA
uniref:Cell filamentation protein Fic n=1 Tax=Cereibacter sphaeroides (strain ATCC 17025 / ATH 2.4.3) TaxID=349102 RepID=A4X0B0_CERS5